MDTKHLLEDQIACGRAMAAEDDEVQETLISVPETTSRRSFDELLGHFEDLFVQVTNGPPAQSRRMHAVLTSMLDLESSVRRDEQKRIRERLSSFLIGAVSEGIAKRKKELRDEESDIRAATKELKVERQEIQKEIVRLKNLKGNREVGRTSRVVSVDAKATIDRLRETIVFQNEELKRLGSRLAT